MSGTGSGHPLCPLFSRLESSNLGKSMNTVFITIALAAGALPLSGADCLALRAGQTVELSVSKVRSVCFHVVVAANEADQLSLKSPFDLAIQIRGEAADRLVD